jgi:hypothetical protein
MGRLEMDSEWLYQIAINSYYACLQDDGQS